MTSFPSKANVDRSDGESGGAPRRTAELQASHSPKNTVQPVSIPTTRHDAFAQTIGFDSYLDLFETSTPLNTRRTGQWLLTSLRGKAWVVWNAADLSIAGKYDSEEAAMSSLEAN
jgi:hypothetical protein